MQPEPDFLLMRLPPYRLLIRKGIAFKKVLAALHASGQPLKQSHKSDTRRVGDWVVKENRQGALKLTLLRNRYRRAWEAALFLERHGVAIPVPVAWAERRYFGMIVANMYVAQWLDGYRNVEDHARWMKVHQTDDRVVAAFLTGVAAAVNQLAAIGAYHADLSGKNIFTRDGASFCFIDLDGVVLGRTCTPAMRMKNHVQLYDSFCDLFEDTLLEPFIMSIMGPEDADVHWFAHVKEAQRRRRAAHEAKKSSDLNHE